MNIFIDQLKNLHSYNQIIKGIEEKISPISLHGLSKENISHIAYAVKEDINNQILIITYDELRAKSIMEDLTLFSQNDSELYPSRQLVFYDFDAVSHTISNQRLRVLDRLVNEEKIIVVASIESILNKVMKKNLFEKYRKVIKFGEDINLEDVIRSLVIQGYESVDMIEGHGQFSVRGGIIDFFPITNDNPYRIELFDNEVDSIRTFDIKDQRSISNYDTAEITPAKEILIEENLRGSMVDNIKKELKKVIGNFKKNNEEKYAEKIEDKFSSYIDRIQNGLNIDNMDIILPYMNKELSNIIEYMTKDAVVLLDEPNRIDDSVTNLNNEFINKYSELYSTGEVLKSHQKIYIPYEDMIEVFKSKNILTVTGLLKNNVNFKPQKIINILTKGVQAFHNKIDILENELKDLKYKGYKIIILSGVEDRGRRLSKNLMDRGIECIYSETYDTNIKSSQVVILPGTISAGFEYPRIKYIIISDKEIFGTIKRKRKVKSKKNQRKIISFRDLKIGDFVVHENHGIGKYVGMEQLNVQGVKKDYLSVKYSGRDRLYIPVDQIDLIQKYMGSDAGKPKVSKLGSGEWSRTKKRVKKAIEDMAMDLLELYARRSTVKGYSFSKDQPWQKQFEDTFPYEETEDQLKCIEDIKKDMEKIRPMDRLLCGDVGYGKTEVALRAAFKASLDGKQVAILVPTTILAQQHYNTIIERFSDFPINAEMLSRFRTPNHQKKIINELKSGNIDIIVGTHRLLSKDIKFNNLGLLIVDEEQRFGVKHKESIKQIKESVDVLTLTATPIPRTLHMSLIGARDMSTIEEPPEERYPIQTYVVEYNENMVREAIIKEINRNGQVYFVYNRVKGIKKMATHIKELIPEARIAVGHGQMSERELEKVMLDFMNGEYDVLVCTTIIETGLDISNVNTMIIHDADKMGLSQLYQLRGRVGRSNRIAFAYFTYKKDKVLSEVAEKRLKAIKEFTEFGSGFKIAMRDLEIRGAGNLLGSEQHGHMTAIGYDLYVKYLEDAVKKLKGETQVENVETIIEINVDGYIPDKYISNEEQKIQMYKKISSVESKEEYRDLLEEIIDRYGDVPKPVDNLLRIGYIKSLANKLMFTNISQKNDTLVLEFHKINSITPEIINILYDSFGRNMTFDLSKTPALKYKLNNASQDRVLAILEGILEKIHSLNKE
ncbi:transcription-repair coupling factor [Clostridium sp. D2Q-14]|uniref:transcription-repair coupling factor n=1 Tax=Anaeromonas gelatinilytica TaxID=2683194 RepID=UPI00193B1B2D|nr:transcription-repair coupling factor [Anaeromonas gelatinilytica]MBS4534681.1 transcription-repair coupling factor [Anaeromonas gelatinilytica]